MSGRIAPLRLLLFATALLLASCSRLDLAYRNLDLIIPLWVKSYVTLDDRQEQWLDSHLQQHLAWHCRTQLPIYVDWLESVRLQTKQPHLEPATVQGWIDNVQGSVKRISVEITPTVIGLTENLSPGQVGELYVAMDEKNEALHDEYLAPSMTKQVDQRTQRMVKRVEDWMGRATARQRARIAEWSKAQGEYNRIWMENRQAWQLALRRTLYARHNPDFAAQLTSLLQSPKTHGTAAFRTFEAQQLQTFASLLADLFNQAETDQRRHLDNRLADLASDLRGLACYPR
ncbi:DUF6279 family lipoprotein [Metapseudomonas resinovorans]|uniref:DUF6279 family lipoprotein n=1 Tax=Metapseudomonas resinovorans TaxID=53412 RepID=UPI000420E43A|nr:DUF6279 family lipoprotein [Pseudomonas resinovorans]MDE3735729.1 DUF6279 family lipoprotein [Pseudomonas resinovorans]